MTIPEHDQCDCGKRGTHTECNPVPEQTGGEIKQIIYAHGGSRIYSQSGRERDLMADTYKNEAYSLAVFEFTKKWFAEYNRKRMTK